MIRQAIIKGLKNPLSDPYWKNVATLFSGSAFAQAIPILVLPLITRLYSKEVLGFYFVFVGVGMLTQIVASLQYQLAIMLPKEKDDAFKVLSINFILIGFVCILMFIGVFCFFDLISLFFEQKHLLLWLYAVPVSTFFLGIINALSFLFNREGNYRVLSISRLIKSITFSVFQVLFGIVGFLESGLILGLIIGQLASMGYLIFLLIKKTDYSFKYKFKELKPILIKYKDIPLFNTVISFFNTLSNQLPLFLLTRFFGAGAAGEYGLANRTVTTPMGLVSQSIAQVFYQEASAIKNSGKSIERLVKTTYKRLFKLGLIPFALIAIFAPWLFEIAFNATYISSGNITRLLIPWLFIMFLNSPLTYIITILNKQRQMILYDFCLLICRFLSLFVGFKFFDNLFVTIALYSLVGFLFNIFLLLYFWQLSKKSIAKVYD